MTFERTTLCVLVDRSDPARAHFLGEHCHVEIGGRITGPFYGNECATQVERRRVEQEKRWQREVAPVEVPWE